MSTPSTRNAALRVTVLDFMTVPRNWVDMFGPAVQISSDTEAGESDHESDSDFEGDDDTIVSNDAQDTLSEVAHEGKNGAYDAIKTTPKNKGSQKKSPPKMTARYRAVPTDDDEDNDDDIVAVYWRPESS